MLDTTRTSMLLSSMQQNNEDGFKDLSIYGHGSMSPGLPFSNIHGDVITEHFNREMKGTAGPFRSGYSADLQVLNRWIKTSHIHSKLRVAVEKRFSLLYILHPQRIDLPQQTVKLADSTRLWKTQFLV